MSLTPLAAGSLNARRTGESFSTMRRELDDLQRQIATGKRSDTYSGLGLGRRTSLDAGAKISAIEGYQGAITNGELRAKVVRTGLESLSKTVSALKQQGALATFDPNTGGRTALQLSSLNQLKNAIGVLNTDVNGRFVYGGKRDDVPPVVDLTTMIEGSGSQIGLRRAIADGKANDLGTAATPGYLQANSAAAVASLAETAANSPTRGFSLRPGDARSGSPSVTIAHAGTTLGARQLTFTVTPGLADGEVVRFSLGLKDGTAIPVEVRARTGGSPADAGSFQIGATPAASAANLSQALRLAAEAATVDPRFGAASAVAAADRFFAGAEPGAVQWYQGEGAGAAWLAGEPDAAGVAQGYAAAAREGVPLRVDADQSIGLGVRANELSFRNALAGMAVLAVETFSADPAQRAVETPRYEAIVDRTATRLDGPMGPGNLKSVLNDFANVTSSLTAVGDRQRSAKAVWTEAMAGVERANVDEAATALRMLEVRLQASYQMTSILSRLSLVNYL